MKRKLLLTFLLVLAVAFGAYTLGTLSTSALAASTQPLIANLAVPAAVPGNFSTVSDLEAVFTNVYEQVKPSVVSIDVVESAPASNSTVPPNPHGFGSQMPAQAQGSGFVWDTQGHIVTNHHVIDGASRITVTFADGTQAAAKVVGADPSSDLAVLQVDTPANQLRPVQMADSNQVKVGQFAIAIGNPYGEENTMTTGIISALGRSLPSNDGNITGPSYTIPDVIQTDAPINPGNSGGVLLNIQGQVVGVTAAIESGSGSSAGIGFAIPSAIVQKVVPALIKSGKYEHPYLGISGTTLNASLATAMQLDANQRGALVASVTPGGPADKAGLKGSTQPATIDGIQTRVGGDVITAIDGQSIKTFDDLVAYLARATQVNQKVTLTILRNGQTQTVQVTLAARPTQ